MSIVDGSGLITWEGGLFVPGSDLLRRIQWAFAQIRAAGGTIYLNEAGRPFGVPSDANVRSSSQTASGLSTVWYQWGRYLRGETPSAADPRSGNVFASEHTQGIATDTNAPTLADMQLRAKYFTLAGMRNTISSESWHWAIRGNPLVNIGASTAASGGATKIDNSSSPDSEDYSMTQGAFFRMGDGQPPLGGIAAGSIMYQGEPGEPLLAITGEQWAGYSANHNTRADLTQPQMQKLVARVGTYILDGNGRRRAPVAGELSYDGFAYSLS